MKAKKLIVGIDPGKQTGIAVVQIAPKQVIGIENRCFWGAYEYVKSFERDTTLVIVEDGGLVSCVFHDAANRRAQDMTAKRVGGNHKEGDLLASGLERLGYDVVRTRPRNTKRPARYVEKITGFGGRSNQHTRDAIMIAWGGIGS